MKIKYRLYVLLGLIAFYCSCNKEETNDATCSVSLANYADTLYIGTDTVFIVFHTSASGNPATGVIELAGRPSLPPGTISVDLFQCKRGSSCSESTAIDTSLVVLDGEAYMIDIPAWAVSTETEGFIRLQINGVTYVIRDPHAST